MAMVDMVYWLPIIVGHVAWSKCRQPPGALLYSSRKPSELLPWNAMMTAL